MDCIVIADSLGLRLHAPLAKLARVNSPSSHPEQAIEGASPRVSPPAADVRLAQQLYTALLSVLMLTVLAGGVFPLVPFAIAVPLFPYQTDGSLTVLRGTVVGSRPIGQDFTRPEWFQPRPSAAGTGYDAVASVGTNLSPNNPKLKEGASGFAGVRALARQYRQRNGLAPGTASLDSVG